MNLDSAERRYNDDPYFRHLVENLMAFIHKLELSPSEIREAAMYACYRYEMIHPRPLLLRFEDEANAALDFIRKAKERWA